MSGVQMRLGDDYEPDIDDLTEDDWRALYERHDGCLADVARQLGDTTSARSVRARLTRLGIHEPGTHKKYAWNVEDKLPHEAGLSPLDCGDCRVEEIYDHPCPECGFDPSGESDDE